MTGATRRLARDTGVIFAALTTPLLCATAAHPLAPAIELGLTYPPASASAHDALAILVNNTRVAGLVAGATTLAVAIPAISRPLSWLLVAAAAVNVALVGVVLLADGLAAAGALWRHGVVELLAYSLAGAGFLHARAHGAASRVGLLLAITATVEVLLAVAAAIEVSPW